MNKLATVIAVVIAVVAAVVICAVQVARAEDFEGTWKVPDSVTLNPSKCGKDVKECLRLAWLAEAGVREPGTTIEKRLEIAVKWHTKACAIATKKPCANADRVQAKLAAYRALKTNAERELFACVDAMEGAKRFTADSGTAPMVVMGACKPLFTAPKFQKTLEVISTASKADKPDFLLSGALEDLCPTLKAKPAACANRSAGKIAEGQRKAAIASIFKAALEGDAASHADELVDWFTR